MKPCTRSEDRALADDSDSNLGFKVVTNPIVEPQPHAESETNESGFGGQEAEESSGPDPPHVDGVVADLPPTAYPEVEFGAGSPDTAEEPHVVEIQEIVCAISEHVSDGSEDSQPSVESESLVAIPPSSPLVRTLDSEPTDVDDSMLEAPFLLSIGGGTSASDETALGAGRLTEDGIATGLAFVESPCSQLDSLYDEVSSDIMHSALFVLSSHSFAKDESPLENAAGLEAEDDWTSVDPDEPSTPRPPSPAGSPPAPADFGKTVPTAESDLAVSAVLLTQSQCASVVLSPNITGASDFSSPTSPVSSESVRPRVHTLDRPDWAVAAREEREDDAACERTQRRHSVDNPDWAIAPEGTNSGTRKKGRKSNLESGRRKKPRRAWASR